MASTRCEVGMNFLGPETMHVGDTGRIVIGGVAVEELVASYGTPLYVLDYDSMKNQISRYRDALTQLEPAGLPCYAGKAFLARAMAGFLEEEGIGLDVVSGGELHTALSAGFNPERILFHGNVKTREEVELAISRNVGNIVIDSLTELHLVNDVAQSHGKKAPVLLRLTPGIDAHTHDFIRTGHFDTKFGFAMNGNIHTEAVKQALALPFIQLNGFHAHIGSQILETDPFVSNAEVLLTFSRELFELHGYWPAILDVGGGIGVQYSEEDVPPDLGEVVSRIKRLIEQWTPSSERPPQLLMEPGRSIVAEAGITIYTVWTKKVLPSGKQIVSVDGGMGDNIRPALYQARYPALVDGKTPGPQDEPVTIAGRYCETGDVVIPGITLPPVEVGDRIVVLATGAYNYTMASNYNRVPRPPVILVSNGQMFVWVRGESWDDMSRLDEAWQRP